MGDSFLTNNKFETQRGIYRRHSVYEGQNISICLDVSINSPSLFVRYLYGTNIDNIVTETGMFINEILLNSR